MYCVATEGVTSSRADRGVMRLIGSVGVSAHETRTVSAKKAGAKRWNERLMGASASLEENREGTNPRTRRAVGGHSLTEYDVAKSEDRSTCVCTTFSATMKRAGEAPHVAVNNWFGVLFFPPIALLGSTSLRVCTEDQLFPSS